MRLFFEEHVKFLVSYIPGHTCTEVAEEFSKKYFPVTPKQIHDFKCNNKIRSGTRCGKPKNCGRVFPKEIHEFICANNKGKTLTEITALVNETFRKTYTKKQLRSFRKSNHLVSGLTGRFEKGCVPANKGRKGWYAPGSEKAWFRKGNEPHNKASVGTETMTTMGYIKVKVAEPDVWEFKHRMVWEKNHGKVPPGHAITFLDGNKTNCELANLRLISTAENAVLNLTRLRCADMDLMETSLAIAKLKLKIGAITREKKKKNEQD